MNENLVLASARRAVLTRLSVLQRHFCADDVEEMVSLTVERFYTRGSYDPAKASAQTYVSRIATHVVQDYVVSSDASRKRSLCLDERKCLLLEAQEADSRLLEREKVRVLEVALKKLAPRFREFFVLISSGCSYGEIARIKGMTAGHVAVEAYRMRRQLKSMMAPVR